MTILKLNIPDTVEGIAELSGIHLREDFAAMKREVLIAALESGLAARGMTPAAGPTTRPRQ
jgi:hypothetical protein